MNRQVQISDTRGNIRKIIEHLTNIINVAKQQNFTFSDKDIDNINELKKCIQIIENERLLGHETWEKESIKHEALRNKLERYPKDISNEIENAIKDARGMNEENIQHLKDKLKKINGNIEKFSNTLERLNGENEILIPQLEIMKMKHEEIVVILNKHLANKADRQIDLNEIRNDIKNDNEEMVQLEESILHLKEALIKERADAREEKRKLTKETNETQAILDEQNISNDELLKTYNALKHEATETSNQLNEKKSKIKELTKSIGEMKKRRTEVEESIGNMKLENKQLNEEMMKLDTDMAESRCSYEKWKSQIEDEIEMIKDSLKMIHQIQTELKQVKSHTTDELNKAIKVKENALNYQRTLNEKLRDIESNIAAKESDVAQMEFEMKEMERTMIEDKENHEATLNVFSSQIDNLKSQLEKERKERNEIQKDNSNLQEEINHFRSQHMKLMKDMNTKMNEAKTENTKLQTQYENYRKSIKQNEEDSRKFSQSIKQGKINWIEEKKELTDRISQLNREILDLEQEESERTNRIKDNEPKFQELQIYYNKYKADYEVSKKEHVALKSRKSNLQDNITRSDRSIEKETKDLANIEVQYTEIQERYQQQLDEEAKERSEIEKKIYVQTCNISTLKEEICKLENMIDKLQKRIDNLRQFWEMALIDGSKLKKDAINQKKILHNNWDNDTKMENEFNDQEHNEVNQLKKLLENTEERQRLIADISDKMQWELESFEKFLKKMSTISVSDDIEKSNTKSLALTNALGGFGLASKLLSDMKQKMKSK